MSNSFVNHVFKVFVSSINFSNQDLRIAPGVKTRQQISDWLLSKEKISCKYVIKIVNIFDNLNARWLIIGKGGMNDSEKEPIITTI